MYNYLYQIIVYYDIYYIFIINNKMFKFDGKVSILHWQVVTTVIK